METNNNIEKLYVKYFSGNATEEEKNIINVYLHICDENKKVFEELRNIWEITHPVFNPDEVNTEKAHETIINTIKQRAIKTEFTRKNILFYWKHIAATVFVPLLIASFFIYKNHPAETALILSDTVKECVSPKGKITYLTLDDSTKVILNAGSNLKYPEKFLGKQRYVTLEGEAYFEVTKNAAKPFVVHTQKMDIQVLGTKFNVNAYADLAEVKTTLEEGKVKITLPNAVQNAMNDNLYLAPNEELAINVATGDIIKRQVNAADSRSWLNGGLIFNSSFLSDALKQISRKYNVDIQCGSASIGHKRLTVRFENNENLNSVLEGLMIMIPDFKITKQSENKYLVDIAN